MLVELTGFLAATLTTISFVPQVIQTWRGGGRDVSAAMLALFGTGVGLWLAYGLMAGAWPVVVANGLTIAQVLAIVVLRWRRAPRSWPSACSDR